MQANIQRFGIEPQANKALRAHHVSARCGLSGNGISHFFKLNDSSELLEITFDDIEHSIAYPQLEINTFRMCRKIECLS